MDADKILNQGADLTLRERRNARFEHEYETVSTFEEKDGFRVEVESLERIQTANQAMEKAGLDAAIWEPVKVQANSWEVVCKIRKYDDDDKPYDETVTKPLWQVKVVCRRRISESLQIATDRFLDRISLGKIKHLTPRKPRKKKRVATWVVGLVDHHFGKLAWEPETGKNYDLKIAERLWFDAVDEAAKQIESLNYSVEKIILPFGNDFFHIDNRVHATEAGTPQHSDGRWGKIYDVGEYAFCEAIERLRAVAPVLVSWVPGNHDYLSSHWLCRLGRAVYRTAKDVEFDMDYFPRKYHRFGKCLVGFAHGNVPSKQKRLCELMPIEAIKHGWSECSAAREWLTGHLHQSKVTNYLSTWEESGITHRVLASLCANDWWHTEQGYTTSRQATQNFLYDHDYGLKAVFQTSIDEILARQKCTGC